MKSISLKTNESNLYKNLGKVFSDSTKVLTELMQNSRRAGATVVEFVLHDETLIVTDDGDGISDFQKLLTNSESGWDTQTIEQESPFGMGWLSTLYAATEVIVESKGSKCLMVTARILEQKPAAIESIAYSEGTKITLNGFSMDLECVTKALNTAAKGFPIRVLFNGKELLRPHAIQNLTHKVMTDIGIMSVAGLDNPLKACTSDFQLYYQGLPVRYPEIRSRYNQTVNILHLSDVFSVRMPDRDSLTDDHNEVRTRISTILPDIARSELKKMKTLLPDTEFSKYFQAMRVYDCLELLNDVMHIPTDILSYEDEYPTALSRRNTNDKLVTHEMVSTEAAKIAFNVERDVQGNNGLAFAALTLMYEQGGWFCLDNKLHPEHWVYQFALDLSKQGCIEVIREVKKSGSLSAEYVEADIEIVSEFTIRVGKHTQSFKDYSVGIGESFIGASTTASILVIAGKDTNCSPLNQLFDFEEDGFYQESWQLDAEECLYSELRMIEGELPNETIARAMHRANISANDSCLKSATVLVIGEKWLPPKSFTLEEILNQFSHTVGLDIDSEKMKQFIENVVASKDAMTPVMM